MAKERSGYVYQDKQGSWYARTTVMDSSGKRRNVKRRAKDKTEARQILKTILRQIDDEGEKPLDAATITFNDLADYYAERYLKPAEYRNERKISGLRALDRAERAVKVFRQYFGERKLRSITYGDLYAFKQTRLSQDTMHGRHRTIAAMNRELDVLRRVLNIALREGWLVKNPFNCGDSLICAADENKRERTLSREEEARLLAAIDAEPLRQHLKPIVLIALDCALRKGEILSLTWRDINLERHTITVRAFNSKTARARTVVMTTRTCLELEQLHQQATSINQNTSVFGLRCIRTSFRKACKKANIDSFVFHDLRHSAITRMIAAGMPPATVAKVSGHTTLACLSRYINTDTETIYRAASALDSFLAEPCRTQQTNDVELIN